MKQENPPSFLKFIEGADTGLVKLAAAEADKPRMFSMLAYSGAPVSRYFGNMIFDFSGMQLNDCTPILKNHDQEQIVGMSEKCSVGQDGLRINGRMLKRSKASQEVCDLADDGFSWQASMGISVLAFERLGEKEVATVNGRKVEGPMYIVRKSQLRESSFVPVGADGDTSGVVLSQLIERKVEMSATENAPAVVAPVDVKVEQQKGVEAERARVQSLSAKFPDHPKFVLEHTLKGSTIEQAEAAHKDLRIAELQAENDKLKKTPPASAVVAGAVPAQIGMKAEDGEQAPDFMSVCKARVEKNKITLGVAIREVAIEQPDLHKAWVESGKNKK